MSSKTFYLTTTLPYVNAAPHIGFALEIVAADVIARYQRLLDKEVIFNTGTDEHGQKIYQEAVENNQDPQAYTDEYAAKFDDLKKTLNLSYDHFIRTTDADHKKAAQEFWQRCDSNGYIYKDKYKTKYCVGCELEKTDSDLEDGKCPLHKNAELEIREEENYFFKFSAFEKQLLELYENNPEFVKPAGKQKEIANFVRQGLKDFSISRLKEKMPWGVAVPGDDDHVMYVWFDALVNYISTLGWPHDQEKFTKFWPGIQLAGKDNLRQQSAMWQAMLMAAELPNSKKILINGFIGVDGQKMSKSLGNVIAPSELVDKYGVDGARYLIMSLGPFGEDMDVSWEKLDKTFTANLSNGLGNLCSRVAKMCEKAQVSGEEFNQLNSDFSEVMDNYDLARGLDLVNDQISSADQYLSENKPWKKEGDDQKEILVEAVKKIQSISYHLQPFMPETAEKILNHFSQSKIAALTPLFPRLT
jgi:methionyl-tRNA synthetase